MILTFRSLPEVLRHSARRFADRPALKATAVALTYAELDRLVDVLAARFQSAGAEPGHRVGLCVERGPLAVVASAALMRLGCAYVPLDPNLPVDRLRHILANSGMATAACDATGRALLTDTTLSLLDISADDLATDRCTAPDPTPPDPDADAYVMYTSGSTGLPKGVAVSHANVLSLLSDALPLFRLGDDEIWPLLRSYGFDTSVWETWAGIARGATLVAVEGDAQRDPERLAELLLRHRVTRMHIVPSVFHQLAEVVEEENLRIPLRAINFGGEALHYGAVRTWLSARPGLTPPTLYNVYGITETTIYNTVKEITRAEVDLADPATPIGRGLAHSPVVVLDEELAPAPRGRTGELFVGGRQVARGYLDEPELTAQRFLRLPGRPGRWYRTGDFGHLGESGGLHYVGRRDDQVKVRGFRIELGELDHTAAALPWVSDAAAVVRTTARGEPSLALFVVTTGPVPDLRERVRRELGHRLPEHMLPTQVIGMARLPQNPNGKRDRRALHDLLTSHTDGRRR